MGSYSRMLYSFIRMDQVIALRFPMALPCAASLLPYNDRILNEFSSVPWETTFLEFLATESRFVSDIFRFRRRSSLPNRPGQFR
jgi:hypothetical protein